MNEVPLWVPIATLFAPVLPWFLHVNRLVNTGEMDKRRVRELERELDKKDSEIHRLKETIERKNDTIMAMH